MLKKHHLKIKGIIMIDKNLLTPIIKTLDRVVLGIEEPQEEKEENNYPEFINVDTEEEFDVKRSIN
jgi:hypothetical protein